MKSAVQPKPILQKPPGYRDPNNTILVLAFVTGTTGLFYLVYDPSLPEIHLGSFQVPRLNITETTDLDTDTAARVEVKNRNGRIAAF